MILKCYLISQLSKVISSQIFANLAAEMAVLQYSRLCLSNSVSYGFAKRHFAGVANISFAKFPFALFTNMGQVSQGFSISVPQGLAIRFFIVQVSQGFRNAQFA